LIREKYILEIEKQFRVQPVCALVGPRQSGKTTLAEQFIAASEFPAIYWYDLEDPQDLARLEEPKLSLEKLEGLIVIDEIQRRPELFPLLRVLVDKNKGKQLYLILGSASDQLLQQSSETLAGRIGYIELPPFSITEVHDSHKLWIRGGFPRSYLSQSEEESFVWRSNYIKTFLERDIPSLGFRIPAGQLYRFWMMLTGYHGQLLNASEIGRSLGITDHTVKKYIDILEGTFMIRTLQPWFANINKRQVKAPKIYFKDSGILHTLLNLQSYKDIERHSKLGALWEGFAMEEIIKNSGIDSTRFFFWRTSNGAEIDLFYRTRNNLIGIEFKYADAPRITPSMKSAIEDLKLDRLFIIYPGNKDYPLSDKIHVYELASYLKNYKDLIN
jgi:predicted AAA+ superfamily ATPase